MPILYATIDNLEQQNDGGYPNYAAQGQFDLAMLASEHYGKNIRQGNSFYVKKIGLQLVGRDTGAVDDFDTGGSVSVNFKCFQTNKYARAAWNECFKQWKKQKALGGAVGSAIKNDDMEFAFNKNNTNSRTSTIYRNMADSTTQDLILGGSSIDGQVWSLRDFTNTTMFPPQEPSKDHFNDSVYKENKFGDTRFPAEMKIEMQATQSSVVTDLEGITIMGVDLLGGRALSGSISMGAQYDFPKPMPVLCGLFEYYAIISPPDTITQMEDNFYIRVQFHIEKWKPLVYRPRPRKSKGYSRKGRSYRGRRSRRRRR